jgi:K+-transporting ATPase ATPase C chain
MTRDFLSALRPALVLTLLFAVLLGIAYPLALTGVAQMAFPRQANGSLVAVDGRPVGSALIGQGFASSRYFHPRPSAAGEGYDATASSGSNLGPTSRVLAGRVKSDVAALSIPAGQIAPPDLVTTSASGLDPHISPEAAYFQASRVAAVRGVSEPAVRQLIGAHVEGPTLGFLGEPRMNVLELNLALDRMQAPGANSGR